MLQKMKLCKFFDDPPSITHEAVDELLQDSMEAEAPAKKTISIFRNYNIKAFELCYYHIFETNLKMHILVMSLLWIP